MAFQPGISMPPPEHKERRIYIAVTLGAGTWTVERGGTHDDSATHRDLRLSL